MSKTTAAVVCETNQIAKHNQENVFFHGLYRIPSEFSSTYFRSAKSTTPIQIFACFSAQGDDTVAAMTLQDVLKKMQEIAESTQLKSVLDYESFTDQVVKQLNQTVCNASIKNNGASIRVSMSMVIIEGDTLRVMNIGNTHIWLYRGGKLISLTENQTVAHRYVQMGAIDKSQESTHEGCNELTQYLGRFPQDGEVIPDKKVHLKLLDGDDICILGTGLDQGVSISKLGVVIARPTQPETKAKEMIECATSNGVRYGLTATVIHIDSTLILPGEANIDSSVMSNAVVATPATVPHAATNTAPAANTVPQNQATQVAPSVAAVQEGIVDEPTIQSEPLRYQMNQQNPPTNDSLESNDYSEDDFEDDGLETPAEKPKKPKKTNKTEKKEKKSSGWKTVLIGFIIFLICFGVGYGGMYVLFNLAHWTGKLESTTTTTAEDNLEGKVMYVLFDDTVLYVEESLDSQAIDTLARGEAVTLLATNDTFAKVRKENGLMGYVPVEMIADEDPTHGEADPSEFVDVTPVPTERIPDPTKAPEPTETTPAETTTVETTTSETTVETTTESTSESTSETSDTTPSETTPSETTTESTTETTPEETTSSESSETTTTPAPEETTTPPDEGGNDQDPGEPGN